MPAGVPRIFSLITPLRRLLSGFIIVQRPGPAHRLGQRASLANFHGFSVSTPRHGVTRPRSPRPLPNCERNFTLGVAGNPEDVATIVTSVGCPSGEIDHLESRSERVRFPLRLSDSSEF